MGGPDCALADRLAARDDGALAQAFAECAATVYAVAVRVLGDRAIAHDVVQDTFVELWRHPDHYDAALSPLRCYLALRARHRAVDLVRSEQRRMGREERHGMLIPSGLQPCLDDEIAATETARLVRAAVRRLPAGQRRVVELAYFQGLSCRDVAQQMGIPVGTAKSRLRLALAKLEGLLDRRLLESW